MNKAKQLYWQAKNYKQKQQDIACDFVKECLKEFEENAAEGCFSATIYRDNVPDSILFDFDELVLPLFLKEGFKVEEYIAPRYGYEDDGWRISWDLKEEEFNMNKFFSPCEKCKYGPVPNPLCEACDDCLEDEEENN